MNNLVSVCGYLCISVSFVQPFGVFYFVIQLICTHISYEIKHIGFCDNILF